MTIDYSEQFMCLDRQNGGVPIGPYNDPMVLNTWRQVLTMKDGTPYPETIINYGEYACDWCGSLHVGRLIEMLEAGEVTLERTTKRYKFYVRKPPPPGGNYGWNGKVYTWHMSEAQVQRINELHKGLTR